MNKKSNPRLDTIIDAGFKALDCALDILYNDSIDRIAEDIDYLNTYAELLELVDDTKTKINNYKNCIYNTNKTDNVNDIISFINHSC